MYSSKFEKAGRKTGLNMPKVGFRHIWADRSFRVSIIQTTVFLGLGMLFLHQGWVEYGWVMFLCFPVILGLSLGIHPNKKAMFYGAILALALFLFFIIIAGIEGMVCVIFLLPLIIVPLFLGVIIVHLIEKYRKVREEVRVRVIWSPLLVFILAVPLENGMLPNEPHVELVSTEIILPYSAIEVFDAIKSVDTLYGAKPFLMQLDLPVPFKCILEKEEVNALRVCYFEGGRIIEKVTAYEPGELLQMDVIDYELTGRVWLGFKEAIYTVDSLAPAKTKMTRTTTYTSKLYPRAYWRVFEKLGISQEHDYVFQNVQRSLIEPF